MLPLSYNPVVWLLVVLLLWLDAHSCVTARDKSPQSGEFICANEAKDA